MKLKPIAANQTEVELSDGTTVFFSYKTPVAAHIPGIGAFKTDKRWSVTTSRHVNNFIARNAGLRPVEVRAQAYFDALVVQS